MGVEPLIQRLKTKVHRVDADILQAVREQSTSGSQAREDLRSAMQAIEARHAHATRPGCGPAALTRAAVCLPRS